MPFSRESSWPRDWTHVSSVSCIDRWVFSPPTSATWKLGRCWGQGGLVCCSPWGCKELDMTGWLNNNNEGMCFPGGAAVKNLPAMQETQEMQIRALGREDPRKKEMATHSSIFAWKVPWTERSGGLRSMGLQRAGHDWSTERAHVRECWVTARESGGKAVPGTPLRWNGNGGWQRKAGDPSSWRCVSHSVFWP